MKVIFKENVYSDFDEPVTHQLEIRSENTFTIVMMSHKEFLEFLWEYGEAFTRPEYWEEAEKLFGDKNDKKE